MRKFENPKIVCSCEGNHTCGILENAASYDPPQSQDTVENMSLDTDSNSSAATNAGNESIRVAPPMNEDSGIDTLLNADVPSIPSAFSSGNTSPDVDMLPIPSKDASCGSDTTPDTEHSISIDTSSGRVPTNTSPTLSKHPSVVPCISSAIVPTRGADSSATIVTDNTGDKSTRFSLSVPTGTDTRPSLASNLATPTHEAGGTTPDGSAAKTSPSRPTNLSSSLRRSYHEFSKTADAGDDILKSINYVSSEDMVPKKKKAEGEINLKKPLTKTTSSSSGTRSRTSSTSRSIDSSETSNENISGSSIEKNPLIKSTSSSSSWTRSRTSSTSQSMESRDTSSENLSGYSPDPHEEIDWYTRMRTSGPKIKVTGSVRPDGTIDETEEHRSTVEGGSLLSVNAAPGGDICQNIYFGRNSPSLGEGGAPSKEENPAKNSDAEGSEDDKEKDDGDAFS